MWLMPSYGRPHVLRDLLAAPGGWPERVTVLVNEDDPKVERYFETLDSLFLQMSERMVPRRSVPWQIFLVPVGSRFAEAVRAAFEAHPNEPFYGIIDDDYWPVTPGWHDKLVEAAGDRLISSANNLVNFPKLYCCRVMGGELARAIGTITPGKMRHDFSDDAWASFGEDFKVLRPIEDVIVEHHHPTFYKSIKADETYKRIEHDEDARLYAQWRASDERREQCERVALLLGGNFTIANLSTVNLLLCVPIQNSSVDIAFYHSFHRTMEYLAKRGVRVTIQEAAGGSHIGKAREQVLWAGLRANPRATHIMFIDDDMGWEPKLITRLISADHDFAAVSGVKKTEKLAVCYNAFPDPQVLHPLTKFMRVRHIGFAFVLLKRGVIERLCQAYPELEYNTDGHGREWALFFDLMWKQPQHDLPDRLSEDFSFCERWRRIGGEIWIDPYASIIHAGRKEYTGAPADLFPKQEAASAA